MKMNNDFRPGLDPTPPILRIMDSNSPTLQERSEVDQRMYLIGEEARKRRVKISGKPERLHQFDKIVDICRSEVGKEWITIDFLQVDVEDHHTYGIPPFRQFIVRLVESGCFKKYEFRSNCANVRGVDFDELKKFRKILHQELAEEPISIGYSSGVTFDSETDTEFDEDLAIRAKENSGGKAYSLLFGRLDSATFRQESRIQPIWGRLLMRLYDISNKKKNCEYKDEIVNSFGCTKGALANARTGLNKLCKKMGIAEIIKRTKANGRFEWYLSRELKYVPKPQKASSKS